MKTLQEHREDFLKKAREYDLGKSEEDFHSYMKQNNLTHHLSETQIQDRNRENNSLNSLGLVAGIAIPLTFGAIFGMNKIMKDAMGIMNRGRYENIIVDDVGGEALQYYMSYPDNSALSGINTRPMPRAEGHINQDLSKIRKDMFLSQKIGKTFTSIDETGQTKAFNPVILSNPQQDRAQMKLEDFDAYPRVGIFPPTQV